MQPETMKLSRLERIAYYFFLGMTVLAPLAFIPSTFISADLIKVALIALGVLVPAILYTVIAFKERKIYHPPRALMWTAILLGITLIISSWTSTNGSKAFIGQGFELGSASFILLTILSLFAAIRIVRTRPERVFVVYLAMTAAFAVLFLVHLLRVLFGPSFLTLGILNSVTSALIGNWYGFGAFAFMVAMVAMLGTAYLTLSKKMRIMYWVVAAAGFLTAFVINNSRVWMVGSLVLIAVSFVATRLKTQDANDGRRYYKHIAWLPVIALVIVAILTFKSSVIAGPIVNTLKVPYAELSLPWQYTVDVTAQTIKDRPLFGIGPNHFTQAYITYKPAVINTSDAWSIEFSNGFGYLPTFVATMGSVGAILWTLFIVFYGIIVVQVLRRLPQDGSRRFVLMSSFAASAFAWLLMIVSVPPHAVVLYGFIFSGIFVGSAIAYGLLADRVSWPQPMTRGYRLVPAALVLLVIVFVVWLGCYAKKVVAMSYFGAGLKQLTATGDVDTADADFSHALAWDKSDLYWQARAEAAMAKANKLAAQLPNAQNNASTTEALSSQIVTAVNSAGTYAHNAIDLDPSNYYNYLSLARAGEMAVSLKLPGAYDSTVSAYMNAIRLNQFNPSMYVSLARLQANQNKLDDAERTMGAGLQVKNNYLDGVFLLSQIEAAKGNVNDAITAARVATQINPGSPILFFQLGLLSYVNKDYSTAASALQQAVTLQSDYANAKYFLGLALVRLNRTADAIAQFQDLAKTNPDSQEVSFILSNLQAGRSPFADATPPVTPNPEKRPNLPIKEKQK